MQELITAKIKELTENGKLDEIVTKQAVSFIEKTVRDILSTWGEAGKMLKSKIEKQLVEQFEKLDFVQYSKTISDIVEAELNKSVVEIGIDPIKKMISDFMGELEKKEWRLSEIINEFKEREVIPDDRGESGEIAFIYEISEYGTVNAAFDEDKQDRRYNCQYQLMFDKKGKMYPPTIKGVPAHPINEGGGLYGFDLFLFKIYAMGCIVILDPENVETEWSTYND